MVTQRYLTLIMLVSTTCINALAMPTNDTDYSCHIKGVERVQPIILGLIHHIMPLVIHSLRENTHPQKNTHIQTLIVTSQTKTLLSQCVPGLKIENLHHTHVYLCCATKILIDFNLNMYVILSIQYIASYVAK